MNLPNASDKKNFSSLLFNYYMKLLIDEISIHILRNKEEDFYDLDKFKRINRISQSDLDSMVNEIESVLKENGFNTFLGFGGTGLFIYTTLEKPKGAF